jgi:chromosome segregation ATPase
MNTQFQGTQLALNDLLNFAKNSTVEQMALGRSQVEELTAVLRGLMTQLHETAGSSVNTMTVALTAVVRDLSTKVTDLGQQMSSTMMESAGLATGAASTVVQQADNWARQSAEQLARLLERHESQLNQVQDLRAALDATLGQFQDALSQYKAVTSDLDRVSRQVSAIATSATGAAKSMQDTSDSMQRVAGLAATQIDRLAEVNRRQEEIWQQIQGSMLQYQQVFGQVENTASDLLTQIGEHLNNYRGTVRQGYEELIKLSDEHIGNAVRLLGGSIKDLDEYLQDLNEILEKSSRDGGRHGTQ